jgi:hypothetical protein
MVHASPYTQRKVAGGTHVLGVAVLIGVVALAVPVAAQAPDQPAAVAAWALTSGRIAASAAAAMGLIGAAIGGVAVARTSGRAGSASGRRGAIAALVLGPIGLAVGGLVVVTANGGLGTGNGLGGGVVAMVVGLIATALGGLALGRSRRPA